MIKPQKCPVFFEHVECMCLVSKTCENCLSRYKLEKKRFYSTVSLVSLPNLKLLTFSVSGFEFTCESGLFDLLDVVLYHGWLVDPQDEEAYLVVKQHSYNQLAEMVVNCSNSDDPNEMRNGELTS